MVVKEKYSYHSDNIPVNIAIESKKEEFVLQYNVGISQVSKHTEILLDKIRDELVGKVKLTISEINDPKKIQYIRDKFKDTIIYLINKYLPDIEKPTQEFFTTYLMHKSFGLGKIEVLLDDINLEEIVINNSSEPVWVYHHKHGWLKTNITLESEEIIKHYSSLIGRRIGRSISLLTPLLDAHLETGDRVNATLAPISTKGNTITLRKFASKPITITDFILNKVISLSAASLIWMGVEYELSTIVSGGTASGKTSFLNAACSFMPPNQRIISVEDTREIQLPKYLHWIPMVTRQANVEGKGEVTMLDLILNSLRMRPDRIVVGEVRRKREAETLFEAMHTGHSVYATLHANDSNETITRLVNPPIEVPRALLPAISMIIVMYRNRRTGVRRVLQVSEILENSMPNVLLQLDIRQDKILNANNSEKLMPELQMQTGLNQSEVNENLKEKSLILRWLAKNKVEDLDNIGRVIATYYTNKNSLMEFIKKNV